VQEQAEPPRYHYRTPAEVAGLATEAWTLAQVLAYPIYRETERPNKRKRRRRKPNVGKANSVTTWKGGDTTTADVPVTVGALMRLSCGSDLEEQIVQRARRGQLDEAIAEQLTRQGYRSPHAQVVLPARSASFACATACWSSGVSPTRGRSRATSRSPNWLTSSASRATGSTIAFIMAHQDRP